MVRRPRGRAAHHEPASLQSLRLALRFLPDDLRDYTGCERAIRRAIRRAKGHGNGGGHYPKAARAW